MRLFAAGAFALAVAGLSGAALAHDQGQRGEQQGARRQGSQQVSPADVRRVQEQLKDLGYLNDPADGIMGARTRAALRAFQQAKNLKATGRLDAQTMAALEREPGSATSGTHGAHGSQPADRGSDSGTRGTGAEQKRRPGDEGAGRHGGAGPAGEEAQP